MFVMQLYDIKRIRTATKRENIAGCFSDAVASLRIPAVIRILVWHAFMRATFGLWICYAVISLLFSVCWAVYNLRLLWNDIKTFLGKKNYSRVKKYHSGMLGLKVASLEVIIYIIYCGAGHVGLGCFYVITSAVLKCKLRIMWLEWAVFVLN